MGWLFYIYICTFPPCNNLLLPLYTTTYTVRRTIYHVHCTTYIVRTVYVVHCTTYNVRRTTHDVQYPFTHYSTLQCTLPHRITPSSLLKLYTVCIPSLELPATPTTGKQCEKLKLTPPLFVTNPASSGNFYGQFYEVACAGNHTATHDNRIACVKLEDGRYGWSHPLPRCQGDCGVMVGVVV